jgi:TrmH family RNA methyltransferase
VALAEVFICRDHLRAGSESLWQSLQATGAERIEVSPAVFAKLAYGDRGEGLISTAAAPACSLAALMLEAAPLVVVLAGVEKPGNVGAVLRSADGAGASAVIVADGGTDLFNPNAIRASLGAIFTVPLAAATSADTLAWLRRQELTMFAARVDGAICYSEARLSGPTALVLGSEAEGLSDIWRGDDVQSVALPMLGVVDSLNVSVTAAVLLYEARRQREEAR